MYYEVHGGGEPVVLLHGAFMTITNNWAGWIDELSKTRKPARDPAVAFLRRCLHFEPADNGGGSERSARPWS
jgi:hypothetical protein